MIERTREHERPRAIVTGGAGFIGSHLVDRLIGEGWSVAVVDDLSTGRFSNINGEAEFYRLDIADPLLHDLVSTYKPEVVFHLAAQINVRHSLEDPVADARTNVLGSLNLLEACRVAGVRQFVFSSTGGAIYGEPMTVPVRESHPARPDSPYGISKLAVENYLDLHRRVFGLQCAILRYGNVYGPRQDPAGEAGVIAIFINAILRGERPVIFGDGEQLRDYIYVDDVIDANIAALVRCPSGPVNIGTEVGTSVNTLYEKLAERLGFSLPARRAPARQGEVRRCYLECQAVWEQLGWRAGTPLDEGLERTIAAHHATTGVA
jgi:UDP-glucose 4-epimerase